MNIINAAMEVFAQNEYKRASTDLIAAKAGVSKGLLFYYFHNKKELYMFMYDYMVKVMQEQVADEGLMEITDFFELLRYSAWKKQAVLIKNPYIMELAVKTFYSEGEAVSEDLKKMNTLQERELYRLYFSQIDLNKFKKDVDPFHIYKRLRWMADGYMHDVQMSGNQLNLEELMQEFDEWTEMFRKLTYKEEYQNECNGD